MIPNVPNDLSHRELRDKNMKGRTVIHTQQDMPTIALP